MSKCKTEKKAGKKVTDSKKGGPTQMSTFKTEKRKEKK
jgi:hypothetical protein